MFYRLYHLPRRPAPLCVPSSWRAHALCALTPVSSRRRLLVILTAYPIAYALCAVSQHLRLNQSIKKVHRYNLVPTYIYDPILLSILAYSTVYALCTLAHHFRFNQSLKEFHNRYLISIVSVQNVIVYFLPRRVWQATRCSRKLIISASTSPRKNFIVCTSLSSSHCFSLQAARFCRSSCFSSQSPVP